MAQSLCSGTGFCKRVSLFGGMERWNGMVEWNGGMELWNGIVEWNDGIVERPRPQIAFCHDLYPLYFKIQQSSLVMASKLCQ